MLVNDTNHLMYSGNGSALRIPRRLKLLLLAFLARRGVVYPPWTYFSGLLLLWPPWARVRVWYAFVNVICLTSIIGFVNGYARQQSTLDRLVLVFSVTAIGALCSNLGVGNFGVIVIALLLGAYQADEAERPILSGLLLGIAMLKPQLTAPFLLVALLGGRFRALAVTAIYLIVGTVAIWIISGLNPLLMLVQSVQTAGL